jgi:hypothetical protein
MFQIKQKNYKSCVVSHVFYINLAFLCDVSVSILNTALGQTMKFYKFYNSFHNLAQLRF